MEAALFSTSKDVDGNTWKLFVASMEAIVTSMAAGLLPTSIGDDGRLGSMEVDLSRWKLSWV